MKISGFTIVRNAVRLDYPFRESVESVLPLCDEFVINCGDSADGTRDVCAELEREHPDRIKVIESVWEHNNQAGGYQLKCQSDAALAACLGRWCFYVQADEVVHEKDFPAIRSAMGRADSRPDIDGLVFEYRHFYGSYAYQIQGRNWYRREVRLFKNGRGIEAFRDAQGFRRADNRLQVFPANARVFHYGYVRTPASLGAKSTEMAQWWGDAAHAKPAAVVFRRHIGLSLYRGNHPAVMASRLRAINSFDPKECRRKWDRDEIKNALTLLWESFFPFRIAEFRNYDICR